MKIDKMGPPFLSILSRDYENRNENPVEQLKKMPEVEKLVLHQEYEKFIQTSTPTDEAVETPTPSLEFNDHGKLEYKDYSLKATTGRKRSYRNRVSSEENSTQNAMKRFEELQEKNMFRRRNPTMIQMPRQQPEEDDFFKFITLVIGYLLTLLKKPYQQWTIEEKENIKDMVERVEDKTWMPEGSPCKGKIYHDLIMQIDLITRELTLGSYNHADWKNKEFISSLEFTVQMLKKPKWNHQDKKQLKARMETIERATKTNQEPEEEKLTQLQMDLIMMLPELYATRFIYHQGEILHLDQGVYRDTDHFYDLVNEIIDIPEWEIADCIEIKRHFDQMAEAGLFHNMKLAHTSEYGDLNAPLLKYMKLLCQQIDLKAREATSDLIERLKRKKSWSQWETAKLFMKLKPTDRHGNPRPDAPNEEEEKQIFQLIDMMEIKSNHKFDYLNLAGPRRYSRNEQYITESQRFHETESSISTKDLLKKLNTMPVNQWTRRDLHTLRVRITSDPDDIELNRHSLPVILTQCELNAAYSFSNLIGTGGITINKIPCTPLQLSLIHI